MFPLFFAPHGVALRNIPLINVTCGRNLGLWAWREEFEDNTEISNTMDLGRLGESKHLIVIHSQVGTLHISANCVRVCQLGFTVNNKVSESCVEDLKKSNNKFLYNRICSR